MYELVDPPLVGTERETLRGYLDYHRNVLRKKAWGLSESEARQTVGSSDLHLLGLIRHLAFVEQYWFPGIFAGGDPIQIFDDSIDPDRDLHPTSEETLAEAFAMLDTQIAMAQSIEKAATSLDEVAARLRRSKPVSLRWIMVHMIEEYARHCGHADLLREAIDQQKGD
jgi:Protein of unknown function (DUF664)